ncbi:DUF4856 domain-containing protein [Winogradskyella sp. 4-2091]|uniref:DUF4856 domain-containing protein n=1 Tax=Winogradskyella sp. 4-2091 TaxID=3381659 RepID=UPI003891B470
MTKRFALSLFAVGALFTSCSSDDDNGTSGPQVEEPATYQFERNGTTTVSYDGQTTRIEMAEEFVSSLTDTSKSEAELDGMFTNTGNYFSTSDLNESTKNIRSKTAASTDYYSANTTDATAIKAQFDTWIESQVTEVFPNWNTDAVSGTAGKIQEAGGGSTRYVNAKGVEYNQVVAKGLIGGLMADQILNNYLSPAVLDAGNNVEDNDNDVLDGSSNYTSMEHKWDEAFGYLYGTDDVLAPQLGADSFLNKYLSRVEGDEDFAGIAQDIYDAFKLGRAAIVAKNYTVRDQQADIIKEKLSIVIGVRAVHYLQAGKSGLGSDYASSFHDLSEGLGFVYSLQFTRQPGTDIPYLSKTEVDAFVSELLEGNGFWDVTTDTLDDISEDIADRFSFTVAETAS